MKIKTLLIVGLLFSVANIFAQIPIGYYDGTAGLTGAALKTKLWEIIKNGHQDKGYDGLWTAYYTTDRDKYYENDNSLLDMYSEKPTSTDSYNFTLGSNQCGVGGNYNSEGDCYNREHTIPQSSFNDGYPMRSDVHHVLPTDGYVNNRRGTYPYGVVASSSWTSTNGSKLGSSAVNGYSGTVFEPIDEFKGDFARIIFYFATRYENIISTVSFPMFGNSAYPGISSWSLPMLLQWHKNDPVSEKEINRNNAAYSFQGNRNPFIDHPEYINSIWGTTTPDTEAPSTPTNLIVTGSTSSTISLSWTASTDNIIVAAYDIYVDGTLKTFSASNSATVTGLNPSTTYTFFIKAKDATGNTSNQSNTATGTTTENTGGGGSTGTTCGTETFETIPASSSSYSTRTWTSNSITWTATDARTDQNLNNRAILIQNGSLTSSTISGGIGSLTVSTKQYYSGSAGSFNLLINGTVVGTIPYTSSTSSSGGTITTTTISNINLTGNNVIKLTNNSTSTRVAIDDLSWTCYSGLSTTENNKVSLNIYPNPVKNNTLFVNGKNIEKIKRVEIYNVNGILVQVIEKPFNNKNYLVLKNLPKGMYFLKFDNNAQKFVVE
jgi:endonuclease I/chitodextrinase